MNIIEIEGLEKSFDLGDSETKVLKGIDFQIQKGTLSVLWVQVDLVKRHCRSYSED